MSIERSNEAKLPTKYGNFIIKAYKCDAQEHLLLISENFHNIKVPNVRIHSECLTGDTFGSLKCDCQNQLTEAIKYIAKEGGMIVYHRQEGRNIGLLNKVNAYALQDDGRDTIEANLELGFAEDERDYRVIKEIFKEYRLKDIKLITNNPQKIAYVESLGINIVSIVPAITPTNPFNDSYIKVKKEQMGHLL